MPEREMSETERRATDAANRIMRRLLMALPMGGRRNNYLYYETPDQRMFCYTPWKDSDGNYFTWVLKPFGRGSRSGKATKWKRVGKVVISRTRKTARKRARRRYENWLGYLEQNWRGE
jgi:hypothetical protein